MLIQKALLGDWLTKGAEGEIRLDLKTRLDLKVDNLHR